jgi:DNA mismatch endonuclease Vsr
VKQRGTTAAFPTDAATSRRMAGIRRHSTTPELAVREALRELGASYRISNRDLPGSPDVANRRQRWAIYVHGCYWHRHPGCSRSTTPTRNRAAWETKFAANVARDGGKLAALEQLGFHVLTIWECETEGPEDLRRRLEDFLTDARRNLLITTEPNRLRPMPRQSESDDRSGGLRRPRKVAESSPAYSVIGSFADALHGAEPKPDETSGTREEKKNYAERLSNKLAVLVANRLRSTGDFPGVLPNQDGSGRETTAATGASKKLKKTDVRFSTFDTGLELLVSIKTYSFRDPRKDKSGRVVLGRYSKNVVRNDHELRAEAMDHHERHPFAVLIGLFFLPMRACDDGENDKSSFAHTIMTFRPRSGRQLPTDPQQLFERLFVALYEQDANGEQQVWFFDVMDKPPKRGRPGRLEPANGEPRRGLLSLDEMIAEIVKTYGIRNRRYIEWADEDQGVPDLDPPSDDEGNAEGYDDGR